ncbi:alpha/beta hydrolase [Flavobacterium franklandianum]|uniref:Alpha/beta hydrolase n=1 Tax=Flavobacterium franklandianum TaxID=2594430 RepID=A0A553CTX7_9FLAO|nr:alpha/beta hydrolase [Flavobacterium franklandianum]TRX23982.1 alpha/beta hydrolase [Flavobacterium franklandianum]TRX25319.1 alpha/beta hydrolase [Flavobacterium franklandianum]
MKNNSGVKLVLSLLFLVITFSVFSQNQEIPLWQNIPGAIKSTDYKEEITKDDEGVIRGMSKVSQPTLTVFLADQSSNNGTAVIICPGGGYTHLAINKEGYKIAKWFNGFGISAFVLKYRMPSDLTMKDKTIGPLQDAQEAIRMVRRNASKWHLDPNKIGIMGFSAGGHLAATVSTHYEDKVYDSKDEVSARPNFSILIYPVISMQDGITHSGSKKYLLGENANNEMVEKFSNERRVDDKTPKAFLVHATDDKVVPVENSINYYLALKQNKIPVEMHIYENGGHGFGLGVQETNINWPKACEKWMAANGYFPQL